MNLALIAYLHGSGGAERQIVLLANELSLRNHEVHLVALNECLISYKLCSRVILHDLSKREGSGKFRMIRRLISLKAELKEIRPDMVINYNLQGAYFSLLIGKKICGKILYSERGDPYDKEYSGLLGLIRDISVKYIDAFVFQSEGARSFFKLNSWQNSIIIHNSVSVQQEKYPLPVQRENRIVSVGRLHPQKNPWLLLQAFSLIADKYPSIVLEWYGDGSLHDELQHKIEELNLVSRVYLLPSRKNIFECIRTARLFVLSSDFEGMPNALMEAMALGLPCIATDCRPGGARTLIDDGINGYIVPVNNPEAMAERISYVLDNPMIAEKLAKEARNLGLTHTNKETFDRWNKFLKTIIQ